MENNFNKLENDNIKQDKNIESPRKHNKYTETNKNISNQKIKNEESKEQENDGYKKENIKNKYRGNKFNTIESNNIGGTTIKNNSSIQEKLRKIFMNRDKLKYQYTKQDIPENLKYNSDDSESSEISGLKNNNISKNKNSIKKKSNHKMTNDDSNKNKSSENKNSILKNDDKLSALLPSPFDEGEKNEKINSNKKNEYNILLSSNRKKRNEGKKRYISQREEEKTNSDEKGLYKYCNSNHKSNNKKEEEEKKQEKNNINENLKKNILLKMFEKMDKNKENIENENIKDYNDDINKKDEKYGDKEENDNENQKKERKQKLLKLLFNKKENNEIENNEIENKENEEEIQKNKLEFEKENRRRKIIEELKSDSKKSDSPEKIEKYKKDEIEKEIEEGRQENDIEDEEDNNDKGTYISNRHKNKLTISIKPKINSDNEDKNENLEENKKGNMLFNILDKLKKKKSKEQNIIQKESNEKDMNNNLEDDNINESEIEKEAEKIRKKEKRMEERRKAKENQKKLVNDELQENNNNKNSKIDNLKDNKRDSEEIDLKLEEKRRRKKLEDDLRAEINDCKDDESTVNNSTKSNNLINNLSNNQLYQIENEDKNKNKGNKINLKQIPKINLKGQNDNPIDNYNVTNEIIVNNIPKNNLDRSFDECKTTYRKRTIHHRKNTVHLYKPKKPERSPDKNINNLIENNPSSYNPNQNINYYNAYHDNIPVKNKSKLTYIKKKSSFNSNFILNNHSFCENPKDNIYENQIKTRNNIDMEVDIGGALNSSFDAYMQLNNNNYKNIDNNIFEDLNIEKDPFYGTSIKKFRNGNFNRIVANISVNNLNKNGYYGNNYNEKLINYNNNQNRSFLYNNNFNNNNYTSNIKYDNIDLSTRNNILTNNKISKNYKRPKFITNNNKMLNQNKYNNSLGKISQDKNNHNNNYYNNNANLVSNNNLYNNSLYPQKSERNTSINIEDLMVLEEKLNEIIIALNRNHNMHNECFEFWNYYYNCSLYGKLEQLFTNENDSLDIQISINHILISVMICYDYSFEINILNNEYSILIDILELNQRNLVIIYEHILTKISNESKSNPWVYKLHNLVNNFNKKDNCNYISMNGRKLSLIEKITYNISIIIQNIRVLLKNYKTKRIEYLTSIFKKINEKTYEEINSFFRDYILRIDNINGSVLASVFLKDNQYFQTEPAPYIKTKNRKKYSLILDLDETLVHFKVSNEDDTEGVLRIRPGAIPFLEEVGKYYELIVFTAATQDYGDLLIDSIEENNLYFEHRFYRQHTVIMGNDFIKDLNRIGRPLDKMIIVDNMPQNFRLQKENGIHIKAFWGDDADDNALEELGKILINIAKEGGDIRIGLNKYRDEIVNKVTSNISKKYY